MQTSAVVSININTAHGNMVLYDLDQYSMILMFYEVCMCVCVRYRNKIET